MNQEDVQHLALVLLEFHLNLGRAVRENARLAAENESLKPKPVEQPAPVKEG